MTRIDTQKLLTAHFPELAQTSDIGQSTFSEMLASGIENVVQSQNHSSDLVKQMLAGDNVSQVEVLTGIKKAELSLQLMLQVRNKLLEGWAEIRQMQM